MADVTPPGEGPPSIGHAVDLKQVGSKPAPGWPLEIFNPGFQVKIDDQPAVQQVPQIETFAPGTVLRMDTPDGQIDVAVVAGPRYILVSVEAGMELPEGIRTGSFVTFDKDSRLQPEFVETSMAAKPASTNSAALTDEDPKVLEQMIKLAAMDAFSTDPVMKAFLNKSGPAPETPQQKAYRESLTAVVNKARKTLQQEAATGGTSAVPANPGSVRTGRAIELD